MTPISWTEDEAEALLGAMRSVATQRGTRELNALGSEMLTATRDHVLHANVDVDSLANNTPDELAEALVGTDVRRRALQFLVLVSYLPIETDANQVQVVDDFASALGVSTDMLSDLHLVRDGRLKRLAFDYIRRTFSSYMPNDSTGQRVAKVVSAIKQYRGDAKIAAKYQALEAYEEGTLGKTFFVFYRDRGFPLPGERGGFTEFIVSHDLTHILGGFNTDMTGEINVAGFEAGMSRTEFGWELLMEVILDFHLGLQFTTAGIVSEGRGHFHPDLVLRGYERGAQCSVDLLTDWDYWSVMDQPVETLRARYNITGASGHHMPPPDQHDAHPDKRPQ